MWPTYEPTLRSVSGDLLLCAHTRTHTHTHTRSTPTPTLQFFKDLNSDPKDQKQLLALNKVLKKEEGAEYHGDLPGRIFKEFEKLFNEV